MKAFIKVILSILIILGMLVLLVGAVFAFWTVRGNNSRVNPNLDMEIWQVETSAHHNGFTDMVFWNGNFYLTFRTGPVHSPSADSRILILKSPDCKTWETVQEFSGNGMDIRDPKLGIINDQLFIYVVIREIETEYGIEITTTQYSNSSDGTTWSTLQDLEPLDRRWWRPKTYDNNTWYCPIFTGGDVKLYNTTNGVNWTLVSTIYDGPGADETDFEFLPDGSIITSMRIQSFEILGDNSRNTLISTAAYPYVSWNRTISTINRLDGPCLFTADNKTFAIGRFQPHRDSLFHQTGSAFSMKKTSLFYIESDRLVYLSDLPSNGDTSYPAAVVRNGFVYISYYSCVPLFDYPWFLGMEFPTSIYIAKINLTSLITLGSKKNTEYENGIYTGPTFPSIDYGYVIGWIIICGLIGTLLIRKVVLIEKIREE